MLFKMIAAVMVMYAFFKIATWLSDGNNYEVVLSWLSEHLDNSDSDSDGGGSDGGSSSGGDGGGGGD